MSHAAEILYGIEMLTYPQSVEFLNPAAAQATRVGPDSSTTLLTLSVIQQSS